MAIKRQKLIKTKKHVIEVGPCYDCKLAYLMQSQPYNPIIALCEKHNVRNVAKLHTCTYNSFERNESVAREIHPMIKLKSTY